MDKFTEYLVILSEECAEISQVVSKIQRFGYFSANPYLTNPLTNKESLENEIGDLLCIIEILINNAYINKDNIEDYKIQKMAKLKKWLKGGEGWEKANEIHVNNMERNKIGTAI